jgi:hypothetical protein
MMLCFSLCYKIRWFGVGCGGESKISFFHSCFYVAAGFKNRESFYELWLFICFAGFMEDMCDEEKLVVLWTYDNMAPELDSDPN